MNLYLGDCLNVLRDIPSCSVDAAVTDPPYGLSFMGKKWDYDVPSVEVWAECLRVLKPGGHLLAFAGTRTQHRMAVRIEDAGFEIRDMIAWVYGSGFPKSHDVSKAIDKCNGETDRLIRFTTWMRTTGLKVKDVTKVLVDNELIGENGTIAGHYFAMKATSQPAIPTVAMWKVIRPLISGVPEWADELVQRIEAEREVVGQKKTGDPVAWYAESQRGDGIVDITAPATPEAQQWAGWGTALKPALEPITVARKPLEGTVAANVLQWGTGGLNVDGCRVGTEDALGGGAQKRVAIEGKGKGWQRPWMHDAEAVAAHVERVNANVDRAEALGRWPANLIHDGSDEVVCLFPDTGKSTGGRTVKRSGGGNVGSGKASEAEWSNDDPGYGDTGSAARFFYCAKASKADRGGENKHPTVKPTDLMRYLCRLVTPPGGIVLDPFMGSGSTGKAALLEGFHFIGIERQEEYFEIAKKRLSEMQIGLSL